MKYGQGHTPAYYVQHHYLIINTEMLSMKTAVKELVPETSKIITLYSSNLEQLLILQKQGSQHLLPMQLFVCVHTY